MTQWGWFLAISDKYKVVIISCSSYFSKTCFWYRVPDIFNLPFIYFTKLWFGVVHHHSKRPHSFHVEFHENLWLSLVSLSQIYIYLPQRVPPLIFTHKIIFKVCLYFFNAFSSCHRVITKSLGALYCKDL